MFLLGQEGPPREQVEEAIADLVRFQVIQDRIRLGRRRPAPPRERAVAYNALRDNLHEQPEAFLYQIVGRLAGPILVEMVNDEIERYGEDNNEAD